ncbi:MAG: cell division protein FtsA, partial [Gemmatimonadales bacterium]
MTALDLGSTRVLAVIGEVTGSARAPSVRVLGIGSERTTGIRRGVVRDIEETTRAIGRALKDASLMAGVDATPLYCGIAGEHVSGRISHGVVSVTGNEIRTADVARVNDVAANVAFSRDHELLHAIPQDYLVDQQAGITDPIGMTGSRLEAQVYLVTVLSSALTNLRKCVERSGHRVAEFVLEPLAASLGVLTADERQLGAALVELGGGSTNVSVFHDGTIRHTASLMFAGTHVTNDIVHGLQIPQLEAEQLKEQHGAAFEPAVSESETVTLPAAPGQADRVAPRRMLAHIMHMRLREIFELVSDELNRAGFRQRLGGGVILTGGGAQTPGI